jgi:hypothetical protein
MFNTMGYQLGVAASISNLKNVMYILCASCAPAWIYIIPQPSSWTKSNHPSYSPNHSPMARGLVEVNASSGNHDRRNLDFTLWMRFKRQYSGPGNVCAWVPF